MKKLWRWTRMASAKWEDAWTERLQFLGPGNVAMIGWPESRSIRIEAFCDERTAKKLVREFGGRVSAARDWTPNATQPRKPLRIRGRLTIHGDAASFESARAAARHTHLLIPAGMAFGTGDHATTASCLRMLCDLLPELPEDWSAVDAGTGSGILAIAAGALGAKEVEAFDFDPAAVRIARANIRANKARGVTVDKRDVLEWTPSRPREIVMANLYSDLLARAAPRLKKATAKGGHLIFSGVLRSQLADIRDILEKTGFHFVKTVTRGKWSAGHCRKI